MASNTLKLQVEQWIEWDKNVTTLGLVKHLYSTKNFDVLQTMFSSRLQVGTAGLRARMGPGTSQLNELTIIQTTQGFLKFCLEEYGDTFRNRGVVIGFDGRHNSRRFADLTATIFANGGAKVFLFSQLAPTPLVPFTIVRQKAFCGVVITASHNPKYDNGYKIFWNNGAQIIPPIDSGICNAIEECLKPEDKSWDTSVLINNPNVVDFFDPMVSSYIDYCSSLCKYRSANEKCRLTFVYTPLHGVGQYLVTEAFTKSFGFPRHCLISVKEQADPDPEFPTVVFPNPEEGKGALSLAIKTAIDSKSPVVIANDPDADRLAFAELVDDEWKIFTGNESAALLGCWALKHLSEGTSNKFCFIYSTVSSKILKSIAEKEGIRCEETLTGFKWMANKAIELKDEGYHCLLAFEESIGFMLNIAVPDKDGVTGACVIAEMVNHLYSNGKTLYSELQDIYKMYGQHLNYDSYFICHDAATIQGIFRRLREWQGDNFHGYPKSVAGVAVTSVRDLTVGFDSSTPNGKPVLPVSNSSQMITWAFDNHVSITFRTSGTEPKLKFYSEFIGEAKHGFHLPSFVQEVVRDFLQPSVNNLVAKSN